MTTSNNSNKNVQKSLQNTNLRAGLSCLAYGAVSIAMTLANKGVAVIFHSPWGLIFTQNMVQTIVLTAAVMGGFFSVSIDQKRIRTLLPLNVLFVGMLYTSMRALGRLPVPMVTIFKNVGNCLIVFGDWYFYKNDVSIGIIVALCFIVIGAVAAGSSQLSFDLYGYFWMAANLLCTASYNLYVRQAKKVSDLTPAGMTYLNGVLSLPVIVIFSLLTSGIDGIDFLLHPTDVFNASLSKQILLITSGGIGCLLGVCVFWCISETSSSTLAFVGALNKLPLTILGATFFESTISAMGWLYILLNLTGGLVYAMAKTNQLGPFWTSSVCGSGGGSGGGNKNKRRRGVDGERGLVMGSVASKNRNIFEDENP
jgi:GDP-mannose transporter